MNFTKLTLPTTIFSVSKLQDFYKNGQLKDNLDAINYINQYYFETSCGMYYKYNPLTESFDFRESKDFTKEVLNKVENNKIIDKFFKMNPKIYEVVCKVDKPRHYTLDGNYYINECKGLLHKTYKNFDEYSNEIKQKVLKFIDFIKVVHANNDEKILESILKYYSQICRGQKTEVILYNKSGEGIGKSFLSNFMIKFVLGENVCLISGTEPLLTSYNKIYMGKLYIVFEELPTFSDSQWSGVSSRLKTLTTEQMVVFRDLYEKPFQAENMCNFVINTNVEALKDSNGRRIIILNLNPIYKGDKTNYFKILKDSCYNNEVGEAFYSYLMTKIDPKDFYAQKDFPETGNKRIAIANQLDSVQKFLKFEYLLKNQVIGKISPINLLDAYLAFCMNEGIKRPKGRNSFYQCLTDMGFPYDKNGYNISMKQIKSLADKEKWVCEFDDLSNNEELNIEEEIDYKTLYLELLNKPKKKKRKNNEDLNNELN